MKVLFAADGWDKWVPALRAACPEAELLQSAAWVGVWLHWLQPDNAAELPQLQHQAIRHSTLAQCAEALLQWQPPRPQPHLAAA